MGLLWVVLQLICLVPLYRAVPINRQVGLSENIYITSRNDTYGNEQKVCVIDDVLYHDGDSIPTTSPCEHCICRPPGFACTIINCEIKAGCKAIKRSNQCCPEYKCECERSGQIYQNGEKITDPDTPCEVCYCQGGEVICAVIECYWRDDCEPRYVPGRCCPNYDHCPPLKPLHPGRPTPRPTTSSTSTAVSITTRPTYPTEYFTSPTTSQQSSTSQGFPQQDHLTSIAPAQDISEEPVPLQESITSKSPLPETTTAVLQDITAQQLPEGVATDGLPPEITFTLKPDAETSQHHPEEPTTAEIDKEGSQTTQASDVNVPSQEPETLIIQIIEDDKDVEPAATTATTTTTTTQDVSGATLPSESSEVEELTQTEDDANATMVVSDEKSSSEQPIVTTIAFSSASEDLHTVSQLAESSTGSSDTMPLSDLEQNLHQPLHDTQTTLIAGTQYEETSQHELASTEIPTVFIDELQTPEDKSTPRPQSDIIEATVIESGTPEQQQDVQQQDVQILEIQNDENTQDPAGGTEGQGDLQEHANAEPNPKPIYEDQNIYDTDVNPYIPQDIAQDSGEDSVQSEHEQPQGELANDNIELKTHTLQDTVKDESQIDDLPEVEQDIQSQNLHSSDTDSIDQSQNEDYEEKDQHGVQQNIGNSQQLENTNTELKTDHKETTESKDELNLDIDQEIQQKPNPANLLKDTSDTDLPGTHVNPVEYTSEIKENDGLQGYQPIENIANIKDLIETIVQAREPVVVSEFDMDEPVEQMDQEHTESSATTLNDVVILSLIKHTPQNEIQNVSETDLESTPEATGESITESSQINEEQQQYQDPEENYSSNIQTENQEAQTAPPTNGEIQSTTATEGIPISNDNSLNKQTSKEENSATQQYPVSPTDRTYETDTETEETLMLRHSGLLENNNSDANDDYLETDEDAETGTLTTEKNINDLPEKKSTTQENLYTTTESADLYTEEKINENYNYTDDSSTQLFNEEMSVGGDDIYNSNTSDPYLSTEYHNSTTTYPSLVNSRESNTEAVTERDNTEVVKTESESEDMITVSTTNPTMDFVKESFTILPKTHHEESEVGEYQDNQTESPTTEAEPVQITSSEGDDLTHGSDAEENNTQETTPNVQQQYALRTANPSQFNSDSEGIMQSIDSTTNSNLNETAEIMDASQITTENFANYQTSTDQHEQTTSSVNSEDNDDIQVFFVEVITDGRKVTEISSSEQPTEVTVAPELKEDILSGTNQSSNETADDNLTRYTTTEEAANEELGIEQDDILTDKEDALQLQNIPFLGKIGSLSSEHQETVEPVDLAETDSDAETEEVKRNAANVVTENTTTNETDTIRIEIENETQQPDNYLSLDSFVTTTYDNLDAYATEESAVTSERLLTTQLTDDYSDENAEDTIGEHNNQEKEISEFTTISTTPSEVNHDNDHTIQTKIYKPENLEIMEKHEMQTMSNLQEDIEENLPGTEAITETNTSNDQTLTPIGYTERSEDMPQQTTEFLEDALKSQELEDDTDLKQHDSTVSEKELNDSEDTVNEKGDSDNTSINLKSGIPLNEETDTSIDSEGESEYDSNRNEGEVQTTSEEMQGVTDSSISEDVTFQVTSEETDTKSETESITVGDENTERTLDENLSDFRVAPNQIPVNTVQSEEQKPHLPDSGLQASSSIVELPPDSADNNETDLEDKSTGNVKSTGLEQTVINDEYEVHTDATPTSTEYYTKDSSQSETEGANSFELRMKDMSEVLKQASEETYEDDSSGDGREEASVGAGEIEIYETTTSMAMSTNQEVEDTNREESTENFNTETNTELIREETEQPQVPEFYAGKNYDPTTDAASTHQEEDELTSTEEPPVTVYAIEIIPIKTKINQNNEVSGNQDSHVDEQTLKSETSLEFNDSTSPLYDADDHVTDTDDRELSTEGIYEDSRKTTESQTVAEFKLQEQTTSKGDAVSETSEKIYSSEGSVTEFQTTSTESSTQSTTQSSEIHSSVDVTSDDEVKGTKEVLLDDEFLREQQIHRNPDAIPGVEPDFQRSSKLQIRSRRSASSESWIDRVVRYINEAIFGA